MERNLLTVSAGAALLCLLGGCAPTPEPPPLIDPGAVHTPPLAVEQPAPPAPVRDPEVPEARPTTPVEGAALPPARPR